MLCTTLYLNSPEVPIGADHMVGAEPLGSCLGLQAGRPGAAGQACVLHHAAPWWGRLVFGGFFTQKRSAGKRPNKGMRHAFLSWPLVEHPA